MQTIKIDLNNTTKEQIDLIVGYLKRGRVIAYPTDTIYGLGCDARNVKTIKKIREIKGKGDNTPMLILVSDYEMLKKYCVVSEEQEEYLGKIWGEPGQDTLLCKGKPIKSPLPPLLKGVKRPVTVILELKQNALPVELTGSLNSLAVRLPNSDFLIKIISDAGFPIVSTSLNKTGEPPLSDVRGLEKYFTVLLDLVVDSGEAAGGKPSRLVDLRDVKNIKVIRE